MNWFYCTEHKQAHTGQYCGEGCIETCLSVGPYPSKEQAENWLDGEVVKSSDFAVIGTKLPEETK